MDWNKLKPAPTAIASIAMLGKLPPNANQVIQSALELLPEGSARILPEQFPSQSSVSMRALGHGRSADLKIADELWQIEAKDIPLSLIKPLYPELDLDGQLLHGSVALAQGDSGLWPQTIQAATGAVSGSYQNGRISAGGIELDAEFALNEAVNIIPKAVNLRLQASQIKGPSYELVLPGLTFNVEQLAAKRWRNVLMLADVKGSLSADIEVAEWTKALPESGRFVAEDFDIASALRQIAIGNGTDPVQRIFLPKSFEGLISGEVQVIDQKTALDIQFNNGVIKELTWLPWVDKARLSLGGRSRLSAEGVSTKLSGGVEAGQFKVLGHTAELSTDDLIYGLSLQQNADGIRVDDLFFALPPQQPEHAAGQGDAAEGETNQRRPLLHLSGQTKAEGAAQLRAVVDEIDIGWLTSLPEVDLPQNLTLDGRLRAVLDVFFDGKNTLHTSGELLPIGIEMDLANGRVLLENASGSLTLLPRSWLLRNGQLKPITDEKEAPP